jgi:ankyrin repeat protein
MSTALLKAGANAKMKEVDGETALIFAECNQNPGVITALLAAGVDAKAKDRFAKTALITPRVMTR